MQICPAHKSRAVEGVRAFCSPHIRAADARHGVIDNRTARGNVNSVACVTAATAGATAAARPATARAAAGTVIAIRGRCRFGRRCGLLLLEEPLGLSVEGVDELGGLVNLRLNLLLDLRGFGSLVGCNLLLARVLVLGGLAAARATA